MQIEISSYFQEFPVLKTGKKEVQGAFFSRAKEKTPVRRCLSLPFRGSVRATKVSRINYFFLENLRRYLLLIGVSKGKEEQVHLCFRTSILVYKDKYTCVFEAAIHKYTCVSIYEYNRAIKKAEKPPFF